MKTLYFINNYHLGDCIFCIIFFNNIIKYIEKNNIIIDFACNPVYHKQLKEFIMSKNIIINNIDDKERLNIWIGNKDIIYNIYNKSSDTSFNDFLLNFFNNLILQYKNIFTNLPILEIKTFQYTDSELITRYNKLDNKYKNIDILIVNSDCLSGQCNNDKTHWNDIINQYNKKYKIVTTKKIENINCTLDNDLTIKDIAAISTHTKIIIGVNTGLFTSFYNSYTLNNILQVYYIDNTIEFNTFYNYPRWTKINDLPDISINDLKTIEKFSVNNYLSHNMYHNLYPFPLIDKMYL